MSTTIEGVKFSAQLGALLQHAIDNGFRCEPDSNKGRGGNGIVLYAPDKDVPPIRVSEKGAKNNPAHTDNIRRQLLRAGCPPIDGTKPEDVGGDNWILARDLEDARAKLPDGAAILELGASDEIEAVLRDDDNGPRFIHSVVSSLSEIGGLGDAERGLVANLAASTYAWSQNYSRDRIAEAAAELRRQVEGEFRKEIDDALAMAAGLEKELEATRRQATLAEQRETKARDDCAAALQRARDAEAKAAELERAIAPLRAVLKGGAS